MNNFLTWCLQVALLVAACELAARFVGSARARLWLWQSVLAVALLLPVIEPWHTRVHVTWQGDAAATAAVNSSTASRALPAPVWSGTDILMGGAALRLAWLGIGMMQLVRLRRKARRIEPPIATYDAGIAWYSSERGPAAFGRSILLPESILMLPPALRSAIARHELRHVERRDWWWVMGEELLRVALWFHPAIWWALARIQLTREQVVDIEVVQATGDRTSYLEALVAVANGGRMTCAPAPTFLSKGQLVQRVAAVLKETPMSKNMFALRMSGAAVAMLAVVVVAATMWPFEAEAQAVLQAQPRVQAVATPDAENFAPAPQAPQGVPGGRGGGTPAAPAPPAPPAAAPPPAPGGTVRVSPDIAKGNLLSTVAPVYPSVAKTARIQGEVKLDVEIDAQGFITGVRVTEGPPLLRQAAIDAVSQWTYRPMSMNGHAVAIVTVVTVNFVMD